MITRPIIDAGPGLNFLSANRERLLIAVLGPLSAPEAVQEEVLRKAAQDSRFRAAETAWRKMTPSWIEILSDDATPELAAVVQRVSGLPLDQRKAHPKDLGETMVIAHAVVAAESGQAVTVLIDDGLGARTATSEIRRLERCPVCTRSNATERSSRRRDHEINADDGVSGCDRSGCPPMAWSIYRPKAKAVFLMLAATLGGPGRTRPGLHRR